MNRNTVSVVNTKCFNYKEYTAIQQGVDESLHLLELDSGNYGTKNWNPFGEMIQPNMTVLIKPNLVMDENHVKSNGTDCLYTQPEVVEAVLKHVIKALDNKGTVYIGDAPMQECDFQALISKSGYKLISEKYSNETLKVEIVDFRELISVVKAGVRISEVYNKQSGTVVDLGRYSDFADLSKKQCNNLRITNYDPRILPQHHNSQKHEYYISNYVLEADVIINMPKPKSHRKAGVTLSLKNFVGANTRKEFLPHHRIGSENDCGDEYNNRTFLHAAMDSFLDKKNILQAEKKYNAARFYLILARSCYELLRLKKTNTFDGSWYGNDTISRTIVDINRIIRYANKRGEMQDEPVREIIIIGDMIVSGEKEGPVSPTAKPVGMIVSGLDTVCFDYAICTLMGFDYHKVPTLMRASKKHDRYALKSSDDIVIVSNDERYNGMDVKNTSREHTLMFEPSAGWKNHLELK